MALELGSGKKKRSRPADGGKDAFQPSQFAAASDDPAPARAAPLARRLSVAGGSGRRTAALIDRFLEWRIPFVGDRPMAQQLQVLAILMGVGLVFTVALAALTVRIGTNMTVRAEQTAQLQLQLGRLTTNSALALRGQAGALPEMSASLDQFGEALRVLRDGDFVRGLTPMPEEHAAAMRTIERHWGAIAGETESVLRNAAGLTAYGRFLTQALELESGMLRETRAIVDLLARRGADATTLGLAADLHSVAARVGRNAIALATVQAADQRIAVELNEELRGFATSARLLLDGSEFQRITALRESDAVTQLTRLAGVVGEIQGRSEVELQQIGMVSHAAARIADEARPLSEQLASLREDLLHGGAETGIGYAATALFLLLALGAGLMIAKVLLADARNRATEADADRLQARRLEEEAKRTNEQNQAAILRLMNELQEVADGNLTVQATVTEDITGAIADSVNYTVEELRGLVGRINHTAEQVSSASTAARDIATRLLTASEQQAREIKDTGEKVLRMAAQINDASRSAGESAKVARNSLEAAERGQRAVYNQIAGMNEIREQIQETAKRIKRLGESSQEIGEIVELISDITEQTNVLALNAAIQAASAGEAGRGFSVVAEEVQRLADRSAEAAKQIGALVRTIQTDTQDAVTAMEKSTQGVVEGTKLSDAAGTALAEIGRVSRQLAELIERIAGNTNEQAQSAGGVAQSIERILSVTDQTATGTRQAAQSIGQLASLARELKSSVARFRVA